MPHVVIEYSQALEQQLAVDELVRCAHAATQASELFNPAAIKSRAYSCQHFHLGAEGVSNFMHITIKLLSGRTDEQKRALSQGVYDAVKAFSAAIESLSVEVIELPANYVKG